MTTQRGARAVSAWSALAIVLAGCAGDPVPRAADPSDWGTGIVRHEGPGPRVVSGPRVRTPQALAAGQWDDPAQMYAATCGGCHGAGVGPHILGQALPEAYIAYVARNGLRAMPPFRPTDYTDGELASLAAWINAQPAAAAAPRPAPAPAQPAGPAPPDTSGPWPGTRYPMCSRCHENGAPPLRGRAFLEGYVEVVVRHGLRGMPAFPEDSISGADLGALVAWLNQQPRGAR